jgi:hypothetical protein
MRAVLLLLLAFGSSCAGISAATRARQEAEAAGAVTALQASRFDDATRQAEVLLANDGSNARAHAITALAQFVMTNQRLVNEVMTLGAAIGVSSALRGTVNLAPFDDAFERADQHLVQVDAHLTAAAKDPGVSLELCLACWEVDWNNNGEVDDRDRALFEVERDADGQFFPASDVRRRPVFRFDVTDVHWLRALLAFERAGLELARAWDFSSLAQLVFRKWSGRGVRLPLKSAERARHAHALLLDALDSSAACRASALSEVDDDREWLPNPRQRQHAIPLEVDDAVFTTWSELLADTRALLRSEQGLDVAALARLSRKTEEVPSGFIDLGRWLTLPHDLELTLPNEGSSVQALEGLMRNVFGDAYVASMPPSPLPARLKRMDAEVRSGKDTFVRKLRYLLWFN